MKQKRAVSVGINTTLRTGAVRHSAPSLTLESGSVTAAGGLVLVLELSLEWVSWGLHMLLSRFPDSWPRLGSLLPWFSSNRMTIQTQLELCVCT